VDGLGSDDSYLRSAERTAGEKRTSLVRSLKILRVKIRGQIWEITMINKEIV
jgi:hypothetical protein